VHMALITVLYFAAAQTATGIFSELIPIPLSDPSSGPAGIRLSDLPAMLVSRHPGTNLESVLSTSAWSVNAEMVDAEDVGGVLLRGGEEVAVICPVSGG